MNHEDFQKLMDALEQLEKECKQLKKQHGPGCYALGPHHYNCALARIEELESER